MLSCKKRKRGRASVKSGEPDLAGDLDELAEEENQGAKVLPLLVTM